MSLTAGTITINPNGTYSGTGLAKELLDARWNAWDHTKLAPEARDALLAADKRECEATAAAFVSFLVANAVVTVSVPPGAIDPGVPSATRSLGGTIA